MFFEDCRGKDFRDDPDRPKPRRIVVRCTDPNQPEEIVIELPKEDDECRE